MVLKQAQAGLREPALNMQELGEPAVKSSVA